MSKMEFYTFDGCSLVAAGWWCKTEKKNLKDKLNMTGHVIITFNAQLRRY